MNASSEPLTVLLVDDHILFREGVAEIFAAEEDLNVVGEANSGEEALELVQREKPDIVLLDVEMPGMEAEEVLRRILRTLPSTKIIILTMHDDPRLVRNLLAAGACAYMVKSATREELLSTVRTVDRDNDRVVISVSRQTLEGLGKGGRSILSPRELEVMTLAARGMSNTQIASQLYISEGTVKRHLTNIYAKLSVTSRVDAVNKVFAEGLITDRSRSL